MTRIAVVGGGPGGLLTTSLLEEFCSELCTVTLFEATSRLGGKVVTQATVRGDRNFLQSEPLPFSIPWVPPRSPRI